jgi:16S rRNA pseudouridine516 synthase
LLNKPLGMTCSHKEDGALVYDVLPDRWRRRDPAISTIGRLDKQTSGLLLLTDDGDLLHRVISPKRHVAKVYRATLARPLNGTEGALFASGELVLEGEDKPLAPAGLEVVSPTEALLTVTEGRYHQVRRMFAAAGNHVEALHRERLGGLVLPDESGAGRVAAADRGRDRFDLRLLNSAHPGGGRDPVRTSYAALAAKELGPGVRRGERGVEGLALDLFLMQSRTCTVS